MRTSGWLCRSVGTGVTGGKQAEWLQDCGFGGDEYSPEAYQGFKDGRSLNEVEVGGFRFCFCSPFVFFFFLDWLRGGSDCDVRISKGTVFDGVSHDHVFSAVVSRSV